MIAIVVVALVAIALIAVGYALILRSEYNQLRGKHDARLGQ